MVAEYQPEMDLESVEIEEYDDEGIPHSRVDGFWSPAAFMIGESEIWFFSMSWERGGEKPPVEFVDSRNLVEPFS
ncbi:MAG: hypothetical protein GY759_01290 [Chloroflexi bacterium]|nr:hypothetical protein [Chloroflexota bacterium]